MFHSNSKFRGKVFTKRPCSKCQPQKLKQKQKQKIILKVKFINKSEKERRKARTTSLGLCCLIRQYCLHCLEISQSGL